MLSQTSLELARCFYSFYIGFLRLVVKQRFQIILWEVLLSLYLQLVRCQKDQLQMGVIQIQLHFLLFYSLSQATQQFFLDCVYHQLFYFVLVHSLPLTVGFFMPLVFMDLHCLPFNKFKINLVQYFPFPILQQILAKQILRFRSIFYFFCLFGMSLQLLFLHLTFTFFISLPILIMIVSRFLRVAFSQIKQRLRWREYGQLLQLLVYEPNSMETIIYPVDDQLTFQQLKQRQLFKEYEFTLPKGFDASIPIHTILTKHQKPVAIQVDCRGQQYNLLNRIAQPDQKCLLKTLSSNSGLLKTAVTQSPISHFRRYMNGFYLRLQAEAYLKRKGINHKQEMTNTLKQEVIGYLASTNQVQEQSKISNYMQIQEAVTFKILKTQQKIQEILQKADKLLQLYRAGAIALSIAHIGGFGYMIFFVDWLGWDIIEPLTFSVGSLYSLLGLRFYRKFNKDRNEQSIRYTLQRWVLNAQKRIELKQLRSKLQQQKGELRDIENKIKIAKNRLALQSNLPVDF